jgi:hypothetical protein
MSSQGVNSSTYRGLTVSDTSTPGQKGTPGLYPMRDAQDFTLLKKRISLTTSGTSGRIRAPLEPGVVPSNSTVLSSQFGVSQCNGCGKVVP